MRATDSARATQSEWFHYQCIQLGYIHNIALIGIASEYQSRRQDVWPPLACSASEFDFQESKTRHTKPRSHFWQTSILFLDYPTRSPPHAGYPRSHCYHNESCAFISRSTASIPNVERSLDRSLDGRVEAQLSTCAFDPQLGYRPSTGHDRPCSYYPPDAASPPQLSRRLRRRHRYMHGTRPHVSSLVISTIKCVYQY